MALYSNTTCGNSALKSWTNHQMYGAFGGGSSSSISIIITIIIISTSI